MAKNKKSLISAHNQLAKMHKILKTRGEKVLAGKVAQNVKQIRQIVKEK